MRGHLIDFLFDGIMGLVVKWVLDHLWCYDAIAGSAYHRCNCCLAVLPGVMLLLSKRPECFGFGVLLPLHKLHPAVLSLSFSGGVGGDGFAFAPSPVAQAICPDPHGDHLVFDGFCPCFRQ